MFRTNGVCSPWSFSVRAIVLVSVALALSAPTLRAVTVTGKIFAPDSSAVSNATISFQQLYQLPLTTTSIANGTYSIDLTPGLLGHERERLRARNDPLSRDDPTRSASRDRRRADGHDRRRSALSDRPLDGRQVHRIRSSSVGARRRGSRRARRADAARADFHDRDLEHPLCAGGQMGDRWNRSRVSDEVRGAILLGRGSGGRRDRRESHGKPHRHQLLARIRGLDHREGQQSGRRVHRGELGLPLHPGRDEHPLDDDGFVGQLHVLRRRPRSRLPGADRRLGELHPPVRDRRSATPPARSRRPRATGSPCRPGRTR